MLGLDGTVLKNHNDKPYPLLSGRISQILIDDLNDIGKKQLNISLAYSLISTMMEYKELEIREYDLRIDLLIQWDRLFRFNPGPPLVLLEYKYTEKAREYLGEKWTNNSLNYCSSLEEMEESGCGFVPDETVQIIQNIFNSMNFAEQFTVDLLYQFENKVSITLPVLWVIQVITNEELIGGDWALNDGVDVYELDEVEKEHMKYYKQRLSFLRAILEGYKDKDKSLP